MAKRDLSLLDIERGLVIAPAGCGKTQLIANALRDHDFDKPILVLTHTNSGVAALRGRLDKAVERDHPSDRSSHATAARDPMPTARPRPSDRGACRT